MPFPLSISMITCNEEKNLERCLASVRDLAKEIVIVDSGSTDGTRAVAEKYGAKWHHQDWLGYRDQKNISLDLCTQKWVLALDADEELSPELKESIIRFFNGDRKSYTGAQFNRRVWFLGRWIYHGDWYPDTKLRLFRRKKGRWGGGQLHEKVELTEGEIITLHGDLNHYSFPTMNSYIAKINVYSDVSLEHQLDEGKTWSLSASLFRPIWRFIRAYFLRCGFLDGFPGLWIATATAFQTFVRHSRVYEHERRNVKRENDS